MQLNWRIRDYSSKSPSLVDFYYIREKMNVHSFLVEFSQIAVLINVMSASIIHLFSVETSAPSCYNCQYKSNKSLGIKKINTFSRVGMLIFVNSEINFDWFELICKKLILIENWSKGTDHQKINFFDWLIFL